MVKKLKELSNVDIDKCFASDPKYGGCCSKDQLPRSLGGKFFVVNMQDSSAGGGTHWVMIDDRNPSMVQYFDSMGAAPPNSIRKLMSATGKKKVINKFELQPMGSVTCGWWAMAAAKAFGAGMPMEDFIAHFDLTDPHKNDKILTKMF